jgi:hypothetical protein
MCVCVGGGGVRRLNAVGFHTRRIATVLLFYYLKNYLFYHLVDFHDTSKGLAAIRTHSMQTVL